jgi:hypothetical protein
MRGHVHRLAEDVAVPTSPLERDPHHDPVVRGLAL